MLVTDGITDPLGTAVQPARPGRLARPSWRARVRPPNRSARRCYGRREPIEHDATVVVLQLPRRHRRITPSAPRALAARAKRVCG